MADGDVVYFDNKVAHYFILGCALFSIFWGVINAVLVSSLLPSLILLFGIAG